MPHAAPARTVPAATRAGLRLVRGIFAAALFAVIVPTGAAQPTATDASRVEAVKQALSQVGKTTKNTFTESFQNLERAVEQLPRLNVAVRAALLPEWDFIPLLSAGVELLDWEEERDRIFKKLIGRVEKDVTRLLAEPNPPLQVGLLGLLQTESEAARLSAVSFDKAGVRLKILNALAAAVVPAAFDRDAEVRRVAVLTLGQRFGSSKQTAEAYLKILKTGDVETRRAVGESIATFVDVTTKKGYDLSAKEQIASLRDLLPALGQALGDGDVLVRRRGCNVLLNATRFAASRVKPPLTIPDSDTESDSAREFRLKEERARKAMREAVGGLSPELDDIASRLVAAGQDPDPVVRALSLAVLEQIGGIRASLLAPEPRSPDNDTRGGLAGPAVLQPAAYLGEPVAQDPELPRPNRADELSPFVKGMLPTMRAGLKDPNVRVRLFALDAIEQAGEAAVPLLTDVVAALGDTDPFVRWAAARCLQGLAPREPQQVVPALARLIGERDVGVRLAAIRALTAYKADAVSTLPALIAQLRHADSNLRVAVITLLNQFGEAAAPAVPVLIENLGHQDPDLRRSAAEALGLLGPRATAANATLSRLATTDPNREVRREVSLALYRINQPDPSEKPQPRENDPTNK